MPRTLIAVALAAGGVLLGTASVGATSFVPGTYVYDQAAALDSGTAQSLQSTAAALATQYRTPTVVVISEGAQTSAAVQAQAQQDLSSGNIQSSAGARDGVVIEVVLRPGDHSHGAAAMAVGANQSGALPRNEVNRITTDVLIGGIKSGNLGSALTDTYSAIRTDEASYASSHGGTRGTTGGVNGGSAGSSSSGIWGLVILLIVVVVIVAVVMAARRRFGGGGGFSGGFNQGGPGYGGPGYGGPGYGGPGYGGPGYGGGYGGGGMGPLGGGIIGAAGGGLLGYELGKEAGERENGGQWNQGGGYDGGGSDQGGNTGWGGGGGDAGAGSYSDGGDFGGGGGGGDGGSF